MEMGYKLELHGPPATSLGIKTLTVNGATGGSSTSLELVETSPMQMTSELFCYSGVLPDDIFLQSFSGAANLVAFGWSLSPNVVSMGTWEILANWNLIEVETADGAGFSPLVRYVPQPSLNGQTLYLQAIATDATGARESTPVQPLHFSCP